MPKRKEKKYCGDQDEIPDGYDRRGSRYECLKKGIGTGLYLLNKKKKSKSKYKNESEEEKELRYLREEKRKRKKKDLDKFDDKEFHENFLDKNFNKAKKLAKNIKLGDIFRKLAILWKIEQKELEKKRKREIKKKKKDKYDDY